MKIDLKEIEKLLREGNLSDVARETGIPRRTLQDWKLGHSPWFEEMKERLGKMQNYIDKKRG